MLVGKLGLIEGCRSLVPRVYDAGIECDPDALSIRVFAFDTDRFPAGSAGTLWASASLAGSDRELASIPAYAESNVLEACRGLIRKYAATEQE
jgi:hypothetical protein